MPIIVQYCATLVDSFEIKPILLFSLKGGEMKAIDNINIYNFSGVARAEKPHVQHSFPWITINLTLRVVSKEKMLFNLSFPM